MRRWRTGLGIKVEQAWVLPCVHARAAYADRQVALDRDALRVGIFNSILQLRVEAELEVAVEVRLGFVPATE